MPQPTCLELDNVKQTATLGGAILNDPNVAIYLPTNFHIPKIDVGQLQVECGLNDTFSILSSAIARYSPKHHHIQLWE